MRIISLDGVWKASGSGEGESIAFSGIVPGCVHTDLLKEKKLGELFWRDKDVYQRQIQHGGLGQLYQ